MSGSFQAMAAGVLSAAPLLIQWDAPHPTSLFFLSQQDVETSKFVHPALLTLGAHQTLNLLGEIDLGADVGLGQ